MPLGFAINFRQHLNCWSGNRTSTYMCVLSASKMPSLTDYFSCVTTEDYVAISFRPQTSAHWKAMARQWLVGHQLDICREDCMLWTHPPNTEITHLCRHGSSSLHTTASTRLQSLSLTTPNSNFTHVAVLSFSILIHVLGTTAKAQMRLD